MGVSHPLRLTRFPAGIGLSSALFLKHVIFKREFSSHEMRHSCLSLPTHWGGNDWRSGESLNLDFLFIFQITMYSVPFLFLKCKCAISLFLINLHIYSAPLGRMSNQLICNSVITYYVNSIS